MTNNIPLNKLPRIFKHQHTDACGAACAEMVLKMIGINRPDQDTLLVMIQKFHTADQGPGKEDWGTSPDGLQDTLNTLSQPNHFFTLEAKLRQAAISKKIVRTIFQYKTPCITLISSGIHWVVVYDYGLKSNAPASLTRLSVNDIDGFYILDPFDRAPSEGIVGYHEWITRIQYPETQGLWDHKYVALCDPEPPGDKKKGKNMISKKKKAFGKESQDSFDEANTPNVNKTNDPYKADQPKESKLKNANPEKVPNEKPPKTRNKKSGPNPVLIDDKTAGAYSMSYLKPGGLYNPEKFTRMMEDPVPGKPMLVRALESKDFWYIVPFLEKNKQIGGMMRVNAKDGTFQEAVFAMYEDQPLQLTPLSETQIAKILIHKYGKPSGKIVFDRILVWKPCVQSYSRFQPFYRVKWGTGTKYVRIDGEPFSSLTQRRHRKI